MLFCLSVASAKETFFSALESQAAVEKEGGTVVGGSFVPGKFGNGFVSEEQGDVIHFSVEDRFVNLEEGTVELWVTMGYDISTVTDELFLFMTYKRGTDAVFLQFDNGLKARPLGSMQIVLRSIGKRVNTITWQAHGDRMG